jgi:hypothetical protein
MVAVTTTGVTGTETTDHAPILVGGIAVPNAETGGLTVTDECSFRMSEPMLSRLAS